METNRQADFDSPGPGAARISIVCGPSCSGKSSYLHWCRLRGILPPEATVRMAHEFRPVEPGSVTWVHYNTLRRIDQLYSGRAGPVLGASQSATVDFQDDSAWRAILRSPAEKSAIVVVTPERDLYERAQRRHRIEPGREDDAAYPSRRWIDRFSRIDMAGHYRQWLSELSRHGIPAILVDGTTAGFDEIADTRSVIARVNRRATAL